MGSDEAEHRTYPRETTSFNRITIVTNTSPSVGKAYAADYGIELAPGDHFAIWFVEGEDYTLGGEVEVFTGEVYPVVIGNGGYIFENGKSANAIKVQAARSVFGQ